MVQDENRKRNLESQLDLFSVSLTSSDANLSVQTKGVQSDMRLS